MSYRAIFCYSKSGFLYLTLIVLWAGETLCVRGWPVHSRVFCSTSGLYPLDASGTLPLCVFLLLWAIGLSLRVHAGASVSTPAPPRAPSACLSGQRTARGLSLITTYSL